MKVVKYTHSAASAVQVLMKFSGMAGTQEKSDSYGTL